MSSMPQVADFLNEPAAANLRPPVMLKHFYARLTTSLSSVQKSKQGNSSKMSTNSTFCTVVRRGFSATQLVLRLWMPTPSPSLLV